VALPNQGQRVAKPLKRPGVVRVECDAHGWMLGWVYVAENPYFAVTGKDGGFVIKDVPPGSYTLVGWQEFTGEVEMPVTVKAKEVVSVPVELKKK
jgi:Polysaccharide lyase family 4, domain II